jgi:DNA-binding beta-propeller fold protein YncE
MNVKAVLGSADHRLAAYLAGAASMACLLGLGAYAEHALAAKSVAVGNAVPRQTTPGAVQLSDPQGVAVDTQGNLYVADTGNHRVVKLAPAGQTLAEWRLGTEERSAPAGIALDGDGNVYVADWQASQVFKLAPTGLLLGQWGAPGRGPGVFDGPRALTLDADGNVYVADSGNQRIQKLAPTGEAVGQWGSPPSREAPPAPADALNEQAPRTAPPGPTAAPTAGP